MGQDENIPLLNEKNGAGERGKEEEGMLLKACSSLSSEEEERGKGKEGVEKGKVDYENKKES